jgi:hypothetical protein
MTEERAQLIRQRVRLAFQIAEIDIQLDRLTEREQANDAGREDVSTFAVAEMADDG